MENKNWYVFLQFSSMICLYATVTFFKHLIKKLASNSRMLSKYLCYLIFRWEIVLLEYVSKG